MKLCGYGRTEYVGNPVGPIPVKSFCLNILKLSNKESKRKKVDSKAYGSK